jgi:hypothetical protein
MGFKRYDKIIRVNNVDVPIEVIITVEDDFEGALLDQDFETPGQRAEYVKKLDTGQLFAGIIVVEAIALGIIGIDTLGGCELVPNNLFNSEPFEASVQTYLSDYGMEENAINDLINQLARRHAELTKQAEVFKPFAK